MRLKPVTLTDKLTLTEDTTNTYDKLPRNRFLQRIDMLVKLVISNSGTTQAVTEEQIISLIKRIRVITNGDVVHKNVNGYRLFKAMHILTGTKPYSSIPTSIAGSGSATFRFKIPLVFALDPANVWDLSAVIPAHLTSSFNLEVDMGKVSDIDADFSLTTKEAEFTVTELFADRSEADKLWGSELQNLRGLREIEIGSKAIDTTYTEYNFEVNLDVGNLIQKVFIFGYDNNDAAADEVFTGYAIDQKSPNDIRLAESSWYSSIASDKEMYQLESMPSGVTIWDPEINQGGFDSKGLKVGDLVAGFNIPSGKTNYYLKLLQRNIV